MKKSKGQRSPNVVAALFRGGSGVHTDKRRAKEAERLRRESRDAKHNTECWA